MESWELAQLAELECSVDTIITAIQIVDNRLFIRRNNTSTIVLFDDGRSCCESRYMRTDDDLEYYLGATLLKWEVCDGPDLSGQTDPDGYPEDSHEQQFLVITTSKGSFTIANHVEHNGYYGGFNLKAELVAPNSRL